MATQINEQNGIYLNVNPRIGARAAGLQWIPVPEGGVPADLLPHVAEYLGVRPEGLRPYQQAPSGLDVRNASWDGVRAAVDAAKAKAAEERAKRTTVWRDLAARYVVGDAAVTASEYGTEASLELGVVRASTDVDVTPTEHTSVLVEYARRVRDQQAQKKAKREALAEALRAVLPRVLAGEGKFDWVSEPVVIIDDQTLARNVAGAEVEAQLEAEKKRREEAAKSAEAAAQQKAEAERLAWIDAYGSDRLKKAVKAGVKYSGIYRSERLSVELPGWEYWDTGAQAEDKYNDVLNPKESALDEFLALREKFPKGEVELWSTYDSSTSGEDRAYTTAVSMFCPWNSADVVIKRIS
jgi:hypothetical protein